MSKVSIGFRGWRFDEDEVFDEDGDYRDFDEMPDDASQRLRRLTSLMDRPCDACYLRHGDDDTARNTPAAVYGEPRAEVLLCAEHEVDFYYWFLEDGGEQYRGTDALQEAFREWFADGERAPEWYDGPEHVATDPEDTPDPDIPDPEIHNVELPEDEQAGINLRPEMEGADELDLDLDADYPRSDE
ncbi:MULTISPECIES: hypothetical protein [Halobacterium]|uniref:hypothetical protein n=1 Tax=Halobacterium TaxID=2239 RepID=UPI00073F34F4|nr:MULTISPECIES: hypothetical protein [Halobacterium]MCG1003122.1 hypothetical protein [Halobacterium noricense]